MTVDEAIAHLEKHDGSMDLEELARMGSLSGDFWKVLVCTGLKALKSTVKMNGEEDAAFNIVLSIICGG